MKKYKPWVIAHKARTNSGVDYWSGKVRTGTPSYTKDLERAKRFETAREAYDAASLHVKLQYCRACRTDWETSVARDGFIPRWWDQYNTFDEYALFGEHRVVKSVSSIHSADRGVYIGETLK